MTTTPTATRGSGRWGGIGLGGILVIWNRRRVGLECPGRHRHRRHRPRSLRRVCKGSGTNAGVRGRRAHHESARRRRQRNSEKPEPPLWSRRFRPSCLVRPTRAARLTSWSRCALPKQCQRGSRPPMMRGGRRAPVTPYAVSPSRTSPRQAPVSSSRFSISCLNRSRSPRT